MGIEATRRILIKRGYRLSKGPLLLVSMTGKSVQLHVGHHAASARRPMPVGTRSIVRYTQCRYNGTTSQLKAVCKHDAVERILASTGLSTPAAILTYVLLAVLLLAVVFGVFYGVPCEQRPIFHLFAPAKSVSDGVDKAPDRDRRVSADVAMRNQRM
jgi:hypothetical protein